MTTNRVSLGDYSFARRLKSCKRRRFPTVVTLTCFENGLNCIRARHRVQELVSWACSPSNFLCQFRQFWKLRNVACSSKYLGHSPPGYFTFKILARSLHARIQDGNHLRHRESVESDGLADRCTHGGINQENWDSRPLRPAHQDR